MTGTHIVDGDDIVDLTRPADDSGRTIGRDNHRRELGDDTGSPLPLPGEEYRACGRVSNKPEIMLCLILRDQTYELFCYGNLVRVRLTAPARPGAERMLVLRFVGDAVTDVVIEGRNLLELIHDLRRHRIPWLRETPTERHVVERNAVVITRMTITLASGPL